MFRKPFQPPLLKKASTCLPDDGPSPPPAKRQRLSGDHDDDPKLNGRASQLTGQRTTSSSTQRKALLSLANGVAKDENIRVSAGGPEGYYTVLWRNRTAKKHKTWDGDGVLSVNGGYALLQDVSGKHMGKTMFDSPLLSGSTLSIAGKDIEVDMLLSKDDFVAGKPFLTPTKQVAKDVPTSVQLKQPSSRPAVREIRAEAFYRPLNVTKVASAAAKPQFKSPMLSTTVLPKQSGTAVTPRHDPDKPGALVMERPKSVATNEQIVDVVVDPLLSKRLRDHQRDGVRFMYECVMGMRSYDGQGVILADEMGLGKTLQTIALIWTLLKQNPVYDAPPVIKKALIVCPVTLINNWRKEFRKWLGSERIGVFVADGTNTRLRDFTMGKSYSVMVIGYEKLRNVQEELKQGAGIDLVVADEGHRLKTAQNKSAQAIRALNTPRRIILSGTPIQNDLSEFFVMVDFVNPGLLKKYSDFKKEFEGPILKSRQPTALKKDIEEGEAKTNALSAQTRPFILRRNADILAKYLQPKTEYVLFCRPSTTQAAVYRAVLESPVFGRVLGSPEASLQLITLLKKVCNSPTLLKPKTVSPAPDSGSLATLLSSIPPSLCRGSPASSSAKLATLDRMLHELRTTTQEKIVLVSNYTSTLDMLQNHLSANHYNYLRLDGSTPPTKRQDLVDTFNRTPPNHCFVFLLSAKAGGAGLNLIGASRLVLFDVDWNPSTDLQAMARIHRDGQKRPVRIYRLLMAGALDEKVWQRQITKMGLADSVMEQKAGASSFSQAELRDLFTLDTAAACQTHDLLGCPCGGAGQVSGVAEPGSLADPCIIRDSDDDENDDEDQMSVPELPTLIKASQVDMEAQERRLRAAAHAARTKDKKSNLQSLMQYAHIDTAGLGRSTSKGDNVQLVGASAMDDEVLMRVLRQEGNRVGYVFARKSS